MITTTIVEYIKVFRMVYFIETGEALEFRAARDAYYRSIGGPPSERIMRELNKYHERCVKSGVL